MSLKYLNNQGKWLPVPALQIENNIIQAAHAD